MRKLIGLASKLSDFLLIFIQFLLKTYTSAHSHKRPCGVSLAPLAARETSKQSYSTVGGTIKPRATTAMTTEILGNPGQLHVYSRCNLRMRWC
jgi:hypothetical protein